MMIDMVHYLTEPLPRFAEYYGQMREDCLTVHAMLALQTSSPPAQLDPVDPQPLNARKGQVVFQDVTVSTLALRGTTDSNSLAGRSPTPHSNFILRDVHLTIPGGAHVAIVGRSGAGKTTLLRMLTRLHTCATGDVLLDGCSINACSQEELRAAVCYSPQRPFILPTTLWDNLIYGCPEVAGLEEYVVDMAAAVGLWQNDKRDTCNTDSDGSCSADTTTKLQEEPQANCTLDPIHDNPQSCTSPDPSLHPAADPGSRPTTFAPLHTSINPATLSGGERSRIALVRALVRAHTVGARVLVLDEPTASLDPSGAQMVWQVVRRVWSGKTLLCITHALEFAEGMDQVVVVDAGQIREQGTHAELLREGGSYSALWQDRA